MSRHEPIESGETPMGIAVVGACGRMGKMLREGIKEDSRFVLSGALEASGTPGLGSIVDAGSEGCRVFLSDDPAEAFARGEVIIDFSLPEGTMRVIDQAVAMSLPLVSGTTGLDELGYDRLRSAAARIPIVHSSNMSIGISLLKMILRGIVPRMPGGFDTEIVEFHHRRKRDSPSGTALDLARVIVEAKANSIPTSIQCGRIQGNRPKREDELVIHSIRGGGIVGDHDVYFIGESEEIILSHRAIDRRIFVRGALEAALFVGSAPPGLYSMLDVLAGMGD